MVRVFYGREATVYPLADLQQMTATEVVIACTKKDIDENTHLTRLGRVISPSETLSTINIGEEDCLRIVHSENNERKTAPTKAETEMADRMKECRRLNSDLHKDHNQHLYAQLMERISAPNFLATKLAEFPQLKMYPAAMDYMADPLLVLTTIANTEENRRFNAANPLLIEVVLDMLKKSFQPHPRFNMPNPVGARMGQGQVQAAGPAAQAAPQPQQGQEITGDMLRQAIEFAMGGGAAAAPAAAPAAPAPAQVDPMAELRTRFAAQAAQLADFGFADEAQNLAVLSSVDGNIDVALELLIAMREDM